MEFLWAKMLPWKGLRWMGGGKGTGGTAGLWTCRTAAGIDSGAGAEERAQGDRGEVTSP